MTDPSPQDIRNSEYRARVSAEQKQAYGRVLRLAMGKFGPGWLPSGRHFLVAKDEEERARREGGPVKAAATVYSATNGASKRHFIVTEDGKVEEVSGYEEAFGPMLLEPDPTRTIEVRGERVHPHRYSLCWAGYDPHYSPKNAEQLAASREKRTARKAERADRKWAEENPLLAMIERAEAGGQEPGR